uniref:Amino acid transporter transmembrane domain-containing protein n=1 Tax=Chloropicon primus TaxID=1764295 RepID=A0A7S2T218_9CHLO
MEEKKTTPLRPVASSSHKPKQKSGGGLTCIDELTTTPSPSEEGSRRSGASEGPTLSQRDRTSGTLTWRSIRSAQDSPTREYAREGSKGEGETSLRLNPAIVKRKGIKLLPKASSGSTKVVEELGSGKAIACPDDESLRLEVGEAKESDRGIFGGMFNGSPGGCMGGGCVPAMLFKGSSKSSEASHVNMEPLSRDATLYTRETNKMPPKRTKWWQVTLYIINDTIGAWLILYSSIILGMYGWILGIVLLLALWPLNLYAAHLLWRCRNVFPGAISIGDLVYYVTKSPIAMYATFFVVNVFILLVLANQIYSAAANIYYFTQFQERTTSLFGGRCFAVFTAFIALVTVPLTQFRYLHSLTLINVLNLTCMLVFVGISLYVLLREEREGTTAGAWIPDIDTIRLSYTRKYDNLTSSLGLDVLLGAYLYQAIILEFIAEMKDPSEFPKANYWSTPIILGVTILMGAAQYQYLGPLQEREDVSDDQVLISIFENRKSPLAYVALICFSVHMLGSNVIKAVVLVRSCHLCINPLVAVQNTWRARLEWFGISVVVLVLAWALSSIVATLDLWAFFIGNTAIVVCGLFPIGVFLYISKKGNTLHKLHSLEFVSMAFCLFVFIGIMISSIAKSIIRIDKNHYQYIKNATATAVTQNFYCPSLDF